MPGNISPAGFVAIDERFFLFIPEILKNIVFQAVRLFLIKRAFLMDRITASFACHRNELCHHLKTFPEQDLFRADGALLVHFRPVDVDPVAVPSVEKALFIRLC